MKKFWEDGGGFFGRGYMEGDNSLEGYLSTPLSLEERTSQELTGIVQILDLQPGMCVLDCPCGYGRHAIGLADRGFEVVGSDINSEMLAPARRDGAGRPNLTFVQENMLDLAYQSRFDIVLNLFFSFGFFENEDENTRVLRNFYRALKPGGSVMMHTDINIPRIVSGSYKLHERRHLRSKRELEIVESYNPAMKRLTGQWILIDQGGAREELTPYSHRVYTYQEFADLCREVGFADIVGYGGWDGAPLTDSSEDMMVVARKPL